MGKKILQSDRNANLLIDVLRTNVRTGKFEVHDFVVMPDHIHLLISVDRDSTVERAMQLIKGGFSFRIKKELGYAHEVWQRGFSDVRILDRNSYLKHRKYIADNPVRAGLAGSAEQFPFSHNFLVRHKAAAAKAGSDRDASGTTEAVPFHETCAGPSDARSCGKEE